jgi:predicted ATPase
MSRLIINNIGPLKYVDIELKTVNVFIGRQSSGKSTLAKIISFCSWLEKNNDRVRKSLLDGAYKMLISYSRLSDAYFTHESSIFYEGENIVYAYNFSTPLPVSKGTEISWEPVIDTKEVFGAFIVRTINPKVAYIPAERNFVSAVNNLSDYSEEDDNLQDFVNTWYKAKKKYTKSNALNLMGLHAKFFYQESDMTDNILLDSGEELPLTSASSGLQSVIPLLVLINWLSDGIYEEEKPFSPIEQEKIVELLKALPDGLKDDKVKRLLERMTGFIKGYVYSHTQFIVEEPEQNLFPETQCELLNYLLAAINHGKGHRMVLTTHSPYVLNQLNLLFKAFDKNVLISNASLNYDDTNVFAIEDGELRDLKVQNAHMVDPEYLVQFISSIYRQYAELV